VSDGIYRRVFPAGSEIFREGDLGDFAFIIERGEIEIFIGDGENREVLAVLGTGELFGELAALDGYARTASAIAVTDTALILISQEQIRHRINSGDEILSLLLRSVLRSYRGDRRHVSGGAEPSDTTPTAFAPGHDRHRRAVAKLTLENELKAALDGHEFEVYFQPLVHLSDRSLAGFEALIRWNSPLRGVVGPDQFIKLAEEAGLIVAIGRWVIGSAVPSLAKFQEVLAKAGRADAELFVAINVTKHYLQDAAFLDDLAAVARTYALAPRQIKIEITESVLIDDHEGAIAWIARSKQLGFRISIDDFGTGYSSLGYLHRLPVDELKIDKSFVATMLDAPRSMAVVRAIVGLAQGLGLKVVAEGIETLQQADALQELGCSYGQGYYFSRPLEAEQVMRDVVGAESIPFDRIVSDR
jgi:EAL domain-containing protein (putative c-di-GMP-specific phosphodiesterase class I)